MKVQIAQFRVADRPFPLKSSPQFYPKESIHDCGWSHDGHEFIKGVLYAFLYWLESNAEFQTLLKKRKFASDEAFKDHK